MATGVRARWRRGVDVVLRRERAARWFVDGVAALELLDVVTFYTLLGFAQRADLLDGDSSLVLLLVPRLVFAGLAVLLGVGLRRERPWTGPATIVVAVLAAAQAATGLFYLLRIGLTPVVRVGIPLLAVVAVAAVVRDDPTAAPSPRRG